MILCILTADAAHLGRLDSKSLSDQVLMEILFDCMEPSEKTEYFGGDIPDISEMEEVECKDDRVKKIFINDLDFCEKQFPFEFIPPLVTDLSISSCYLQGTMETSVLPRDLVEFDVSLNNLQGTIDFKGFPEQLELINLEENAFCGSCILADLPEVLTEFSAIGNKFSGEISLNDLPPKMEGLYLSENALTGSISIENLPETMQKIWLNDNKLLGDFRLMTYPKAIEEIRFSNNPVSGVLILKSTADEYNFTIRSKDIKEVLDENGDDHPWEQLILEEVDTFLND